MKAIERLVDNKRFQNFIISIIVGNGVILGLMTFKDMSPPVASFLRIADDVCLAIFCIELAMKLGTKRASFFKDGWNIFDLIVVGIALFPASGELAVLRALRVLRLMRLASAVPSMKRVVTGMFAAIPGSASVAAVLFIMYYVAAIIGTNAFGATVPEHFADLGTTFFTLFKMMTLEGWPDIATDVLVHFPNAWVFFVVFILMTTFTTLNLLFGIIVDAMEQAKEIDARAKMAEKGVELSEESNEMRLAVIEEEVKHIRLLLEKTTENKQH